MAIERTLLHQQIDEVFDNGGLLNFVFDKNHKDIPDCKYSRRDDQVRMSMTIADGLTMTDKLGRPHHSIIEAGTGTGKSFAELVPYALRISQENQGCSPEERKRVLVVTHTTTLQGQLYKDDIPEVQEVLALKDLKFNAVLLKGKGNYVCNKRMKQLFKHPEKLTDNDKAELLTIRQKHCDDRGNLISGDRESFPVKPSDEFWDKINGNAESDCADCPFREKQCYYHAIKTSAKNADIMIGNHALLLNDLVSRWKTGTGTVPEYHYLVIDEAHHVEQMLVEYFSTSVSNSDLYRVKRNIDWIIKETKNEKLKAQILSTYNAFEFEANKIFSFFKTISKGKSIPWDRHKQPMNVKLSEAKKQLVYSLALSQTNTLDSKVIRRIDKTNLSINTLTDNLENFAFNKDDMALFYWIDNDTSGSITLKASPLDANKIVKEVLFDKIPVTLTSATIKLGDNLDLFGEKMGNLAHEEFEQLCVKSPFDYKKNAVFYVPKYAVDGNTGNEDYDEYCIEEMKKLVDLAKGRSFLLFTSSETMKKYKKVLAPYFESKGYPCLMQGEDDRRVLIDKFKKAKNAVLFGGDSFWEGIDIKGRILSMVVMQKIPFNVPNPLSTAKENLVKMARPTEAFKECSVFPAIIKFKQGFGRLIRGHSDGGVVALLDGRVLSRRGTYGKYFLEELPDGMKRTVNFEDLKEYIK